MARWAPGARVIKAFNTLGAGSFANPRFGSEIAGRFICGGDTSAKSVVGPVGQLTAELGFDVGDAGPLTASRSLEATAMLWVHLAFVQGWGPVGHAFKMLRR